MLHKSLIIIASIFWVPAWSGCQTLYLVKTGAADNLIMDSMAAKLFEAFGYNVKTVRASSSEEAYDLLSEEEADIYLSSWIPLDTENLKPYALNGSIKTVGKTLSGGYIGLATNQFGQKAGLDSLDKIAKMGEELDHIIYVGQTDWLFGQQMQRIIDSNIYGLSTFQIKRVHDFDFNEYLKVAEKSQKPVVFFSRRPSFITYHYGRQFLQDPQGFFEDFQTDAAAYASVRYGFPKQCPNVIKILKQFNASEKVFEQVLSNAKGEKGALVTAVDAYLQRHPELMRRWVNDMESFKAESVE